MANTDLNSIAERITDLHNKLPAEQALLAGISGIDASGKGYVTRELAKLLKPSLNVAVINVDGWLNLPHIRFSETDAGRHFYRNALRLDKMFDRLVLPLKRDRHIDLTYDHTDETGTTYRPEQIVLNNI